MVYEGLVLSVGATVPAAVVIGGFCGVWRWRGRAIGVEREKPSVPDMFLFLV